MALLTTGTVLDLNGITLRNYSARRLSLAVQPLDPGGLERDANGALHDLTLVQFRKYQFTLTCTDVDAPVLDDVWKGKTVSITVLPNTGLSPESDDGEQTFSCMLLDWQSTVDEWGASTSWSITLLEV
jgi:hypothetical protein